MKKICSIILTFLATALCFVNSVVYADDDVAEPTLPLLRFSAINAGYKDDNSAQNYDFIELERLTPDALELSGYHVIYTNSSGKEAGGISFAENLVLTSNHLVLGANISPQYQEYDGSYYVYDFGSAGLASTAGMLQLYHGTALVDEVCWGKLTCQHQLPKFTTKAEDNMSYHLVDGEYVAEKYYPDVTDAITDVTPPAEYHTCTGVIFSEVFSYYIDSTSEQFIELFNPSATDILLDGCALRYKNKDYSLSGNLRSGMYYVYQNDNLILTKDPTSSGELSVIDDSGDILATLNYPHGQKKGTSYALHNIGTTEESWRQTYQVTPGLANIYQQFQTCPEGKNINESTGNCINSPTEKTEITCPEGKYLNPLTNRCKSVAKASTSTACKEGYYRNPATNRCKKIASTTSSELTPCQDGYERNPETNRCRKIRENTGDDYAPTPVEPTSGYDSPKIFIATAALICAFVAGIVYAIIQFRAELKAFFRRFFHRKNKV